MSLDDPHEHFNSRISRLKFTSLELLQIMSNVVKLPVFKHQLIFFVTKAQS